MKNLDINQLDLVPIVRTGITQMTEIVVKFDQDAEIRPIQVDTLRALINQYFMRKCNDYSRTTHKYEFKKIDVRVMNGLVSVALETGLKADEDTLASLIGRNSVHAFIHSKGGIRAHGKVVQSAKRSRKYRGLNNVLYINYAY